MYSTRAMLLSAVICKEDSWSLPLAYTNVCSSPIHGADSERQCQSRCGMLGTRELGGKAVARLCHEAKVQDADLPVWSPQQVARVPAVTGCAQGTPDKQPYIAVQRILNQYGPSTSIKPKTHTSGRSIASLQVYFFPVRSLRVSVQCAGLQQLDEVAVEQRVAQLPYVDGIAFAQLLACGSKPRDCQVHSSLPCQWAQTHHLRQGGR